MPSHTTRTSRSTRTPATTRSRRTNDGGVMSRLRGKPKSSPATVSTHESRNPITGTTTTTTTTKQKTHPHGVGHHGHGTARTPAPATHHRRKASVGDKVSGALMKLKGSLTRKPGKKAAGTRRMHGTDGRGSHRTY